MALKSIFVRKGWSVTTHYSFIFSYVILAIQIESLCAVQ
jgi:hypothetical protein